MGLSDPLTWSTNSLSRPHLLFCSFDSRFSILHSPSRAVSSPPSVLPSLSWVNFSPACLGFASESLEVHLVQIQALASSPHYPRISSAFGLGFSLGLCFPGSLGFPQESLFSPWRRRTATTTEDSTVPCKCTVTISEQGTVTALSDLKLLRGSHCFILKHVCMRAFLCVREHRQVCIGQRSNSNVVPGSCPPSSEGASKIWSLLIRLGWPAGKSQGSACPRIPSAGRQVPVIIPDLFFFLNLGAGVKFRSS